MFKKGVIILMIFLSFMFLLNMRSDKEENTMNYKMPSEDLEHEGTWLIWPHSYTYGKDYRKEIEGIWIQMVKALHHDERIHIIAYNKKEQMRIIKLLEEDQIDRNQIDFVIAKSNDVWVRDTGPIFVFDENNKLAIANFKFDGWGEKVEYKHDDQIPVVVGNQMEMPVVDIFDFVLEGGSIEIDGNGTLMATLSSTVSKNRNQTLSIPEVENFLSKYLGVSNFIWLNGVVDEDITDAHIDGIARFLDDSTILTVSKDDFSQLYEHIDMKDYDTLKIAKNIRGETYKMIELPLTKKNVKGLDYKGSYLNYYIGNKVVLMPVYEDENDIVAMDIIARLYPGRKIVPIVVNDLYRYGGMLHCVTQQQPWSE